MLHVEGRYYVRSCSDFSGMCSRTSQRTSSGAFDGGGATRGEKDESPVLPKNAMIWTAQQILTRKRWRGEETLETVELSRMAQRSLISRNVAKGS